jgi:rhodanese-like protein
MKTFRALTIVLASSCLTLQAKEAPIPNRMIDYRGFLENAAAVGKLREERRITEAEFVHMAAEPGTIILDARSDSKFALLHVKGARHLSLPDITAMELAKIIPDKSSRILIYCNNNFENEPRALPGKMATASLNLYTFNTLYSYGYKNVYELGPLIDIKKSILTFEGSLAAVSR